MLEAEGQRKVGTPGLLGNVPHLVLVVGLPVPNADLVARRPAPPARSLVPVRRMPLQELAHAQGAAAAQRQAEVHHRRAAVRVGAHDEVPSTPDLRLQHAEVRAVGYGTAEDRRLAGELLVALLHAEALQGGAHATPTSGIDLPEGLDEGENAWGCAPQGCHGVLPGHKDLGAVGPEAGGKPVRLPDWLRSSVLKAPSVPVLEPGVVTCGEGSQRVFPDVVGHVLRHGLGKGQRRAALRQLDAIRHPLVSVQMPEGGGCSSCGAHWRRGSSGRCGRRSPAKLQREEAQERPRPACTPQGPSRHGANGALPGRMSAHQHGCRA
mmetsp:Transcript_53214/g.158602  ORF Transcript_53214/g.158602 Transcript_53214/m.158602 type:complete len:322 (+) Transcript_53214:501-1466(+)